MISAGILLCLALSLHLVRGWLISRVKRQSAVHLLQDDKTAFRVNQKLVSAEILILGTFVVVCGAGLFALVPYERTYPAANNILFVLLLLMMLMDGALASPLFQRTRSFLRWADEIEYNLAFMNRPKDTVRIAVRDIARVAESESSFILHLKSGHSLTLKKHALEILNGWQILFDNLRALKESINAVA